MQLRGVFTALITPFLDDERLDEEGLRQLIRFQCEAGVSGIVLLGTTGEVATLTEEEQQRVIRIGVEEAKGKVLVLIGTGCNSTRATLHRTRCAEEEGADAALVITPYYTKPTQEGLYQHYLALSQHSALPLIIYNIPGRTGVNIETETLLRIAELPSVIGVKEASGNINQIIDVIAALPSRYPHFSVLSGDDALTMPLLALGATGVISAVSNLFPQEMVRLVSAALEGRFSEARKLHEHLLPFFRLAFLEVNPTPIKYAMRLAALPSGPCRLPLGPLKQKTQEMLREFLSARALPSSTNRCVLK